MKYFYFLFLTILTIKVFSQDTASLRQQAPHVYIDCKNGCDMNFLKSNLNYVNHVMDMRLADVYIMITATGTGGGGTQVNLFATNEKTQHIDTIQFLLPPNTSDGNSRDMLLKKIKIIILPYLAASPLADYIEYKMLLEDKHTDSKTVKDKWNFWTGNFGLNGRLDDAGYRKVYNAGTRLSMKRVTEKHKYDIGGNFQYNYVWTNNNGEISEGSRISYNAYNVNVFSLGKHFATGYFAAFNSSTVTNLKTNSSAFGAFEYNVFPYSVATRKLFRILYRVGGRYQEYIKPTVFDKTNLMLYPHSLIVEFTQIEKWGTLDLTMGMIHYLNYTENYNFSIVPTISLNPFKGFRLDLGCNYAIVNDQFYLRKENASSFQVALGQVQLKTASTLTTWISMNFNFGSIYSNVVNVRFDMDPQFW